MRQIKSERLKKMEVELQDLEQWLKLGLVPKKDITKHKEEIQAIKDKMAEEHDRLRFLKESGELEEYTAPKKSSGRTGYTEMPTLPDIDLAETGGITEGGYGDQTENPEADADSSSSDDDDDDDTDADEDDAEPKKKDVTLDEDHSAEHEDEDDFAEHRRWSRGGILDPEADDW